MKEFEVDGRQFTNRDGAFVHSLRGGRVKVSMNTHGKPGSVTGAWGAELITGLGIHPMGWHWPTPQAAAERALVYWKDEFEESDRLDAEDSDRDRAEFEREQKLTTRDVL